MKTLQTVNKIFLVLVLVALNAMPVQAQTAEEILEKRAQDFHTTLKSSNEADWEEFVKANYSKKMLEKYELSMHVGMFKRLNKDFSDSKINSFKIVEDKVMMAIERNSDKHKVTFELNYDKEDDYKFNGFSVEAGELR
jgi:hypothetical protein